MEVNHISSIFVTVNLVYKTTITLGHHSKTVVLFIPYPGDRYSAWFCYQRIPAAQFFYRRTKRSAYPAQLLFTYLQPGGHDGIKHRDHPLLSAHQRYSSASSSVFTFYNSTWIGRIYPVSWLLLFYKTLFQISF